MMANQTYGVTITKNNFFDLSERIDFQTTSYNSDGSITQGITTNDNINSNSSINRNNG